MERMKKEQMLFEE